MPTGGNDVALLIDGEATFEAIIDAVAGARRSVRLVQLLFEPTFAATYGGGPPPVATPPRAFLAEALADAARRGVDVRVLLNENAAVPDHVREMRARFDGVGAPVRVRGLLMSPDVLHAKIVLVDDEVAFLVGPPFEQRFWDSADHLPMDPRRRTDRPIHDVSVRIRGPAVADVAATVALLWNEADPHGDRIEPPAPVAPVGPHDVSIARTLPARRFRALPAGELGVLEAYLDAIRRAKRWIYLETQYFTSPSITAALREAMDANPQLSVILVLNEDVDIPTYIRWQETRLRELGWPRRDRLGVFSLWTPVRRPDGLHARPIYVHSKVAIVDDVWATVGAANLDSLSLEPADEFLVRLPANVETNAVLHDERDGAPASGLVRELRRRLFAEHIGTHAADDEPSGGWLAAWRRAAAGNLAALGAGEGFDGWVLPHRPPSLWTEAVASRGP